LIKKIIKNWRELKTRQLSLNDLMKKMFSFTGAIYNKIKKKASRIFIADLRSQTIFIVGNQRSGTTMLLRQLEKHIDVDSYGESSKAMKALRIKSLTYIKKIVHKTKAKIVIFKPLEDSHRVLEFLNTLDSSKVIWVFRHYLDVAKSSMKLNWGRHCKEYVENINAGIYFPYNESLNLSDKNVQLVKNLYHADISEETCIAIIWYLRNTIFFDIDLAKNHRVLLVCYEKLVNNPEEEMHRILLFLGIKKTKAIIKGIHKKSIKKETESIIDPNVKKICDKIYKDLVNALPQ